MSYSIPDSPEQSNIPYGYCHCGCGQKTNIAKTNQSRRGHIKGQPVRYVKGHGSRTHREIQAATGLSRSFVQACVAEWPVLFCVVGKRRDGNAKTASALVGVVGIHEPKESEL